MAKVDQYLTIKEAADHLGVCTNTLRNWGANGKIKERRNPMSGYRLYSRAELDRLLRQIEESGTYPSGWSKPRKRKPR